MAAGPQWLCSTLLFVVFVSADQKIITAESGQDVTLTCRAPNNNIRFVDLRRAELEDGFVLRYEIGELVQHIQHPYFENRVDLQNRQMKDGDVFLILKDVTINDTGTYECGVFMRETHSWKLSVIYLVVIPPDPMIITAESGQDVTLTCRAPNNNIKVVDWIRADLGDKYVLLYQDGQFVPDHQHPYFKNRVDLQDRQMKDGDVSLILKDVTINDAGRYVCCVLMEETWRWRSISIIYLTVVVPPDETITAKCRQDVTLTCRAPNNNITAVKWSRADLEDEYVLLYQDNNFTSANQHPSFYNRVDLQDRQMKDGDVSLILKDVTTDDTGTYACRVFMREAYFMDTIRHLDVLPPGLQRGFIGVIVAVLLLVTIVGFLIYRKHKLSRYLKEVPTENIQAPQSPQQDCVRGQTDVNYPEHPADGH
ncbi:protein turtle homolog B-like [Pelmatolapia mariae]|uniref:protein turtle homolog B-like n=1 Tax=Pelmatolapia mariae TaxID=158779 RepID=UPI002FE64F6C